MPLLTYSPLAIFEIGAYVRAVASTTHGMHPKHSEDVRGQVTLVDIEGGRTRIQSTAEGYKILSQVERNRIKLKRQAEKTAKEADKLRRRQQHLLAKEGELSVRYLAHYKSPLIINLCSQANYHGLISVVFQLLQLKVD
jgi:hypothetical protein